MPSTMQKSAMKKRHNRKRSLEKQDEEYNDTPVASDTSSGSLSAIDDESDEVITSPTPPSAMRTRTAKRSRRPSADEDTTSSEASAPKAKKQKTVKFTADDVRAAQALINLNRDEKNLYQRL